jgi:oligoribonuclease
MSSSNKEGNLVWIDLEMTGLDTDNDRIIEIATIVTDAHLNVLAEGPVYSPSIRRTSCSTPWTSGTRASMATPGWSSVYAAAKSTRLPPKHRPSNSSVALSIRASRPCAATPSARTDAFFYRTMPKLEAFFHYRNLGREHGERTGASLVPRPDG